MGDWIQNAGGINLYDFFTDLFTASLLKAGYPLVFYINVGIGHAVVVSDYNNGLVNVNDPYGKLFYPTGKTSLNELWGRPSQDAMDWNAGRPVFAVK